MRFCLRNLEKKANKMLDRSPRRSVSKWKHCLRGLGQHCRSSIQGDYTVARPLDSIVADARNTSSKIGSETPEQQAIQALCSHIEELVEHIKSLQKIFKDAAS